MWRQQIWLLRGVEGSHPPTAGVGEFSLYEDANSEEAGEPGVKPVHT